MEYTEVTSSNRHNIFFSPNFVIKYFLKKCDALGYSKVVDNFKKLDEAKIASVYILAISKGKNIPLWLQVISDKEQFPDIAGLSPEKDKRGYVSRGLKPIEIFKVESHSKASFISELRRKIYNKAYVREAGLVCHLDRQQIFGPVIELAREVEKIKPKISDIWVVATTAQKFPLVSIFQIWPETKIIDVNLEKKLKAKDKYPEIIMLTSGLEERLRYERVNDIRPETIEDLLLNGVSVQV